MALSSPESLSEDQKLALVVDLVRRHLYPLSACLLIFC